VAKIIHVDNPPIEEGDPNGENEVAINRRNASRQILLTYLGTISGQENYRPKNLDNLNETIDTYLEENDIGIQKALKNQIGQLTGQVMLLEELKARAAEETREMQDEFLAESDKLEKNHKKKDW